MNSKVEEEKLHPCCEGHDYKEVSSNYDMDGETYECTVCGDRYRLYYEDMK